jgi:hypothetical protein
LAFFGALAMSGAWIFLWQFLGRGVSEENLASLQYYNVANPSPYFEDSFFCKEDRRSDSSGDPDEFHLDDHFQDCYNYSLTFRNCTRFQANSIGIIYAESGDEKINDPVMANSILDSVFETISLAYPHNNRIEMEDPVYPFTRRTFTSNHELNKEVLKPSYVDD